MIVWNKCLKRSETRVGRMRTRDAYRQGSKNMKNFLQQLTIFPQNWFSLCKVEFYQPFCWFYSVPNLLVFQHLVTLYLGGILVRVVSEIVWRNVQQCARKIGTRDWISRVTCSCKLLEATHMPDMLEVEASCQLEYYRTK